MSDPGELVAGIFSLVVASFIFIALYIGIQGGDISGLTNTFADFLPGFVVILIIIFFIATVVQQF